MKEIIKKASMVLLICFSFFYTDKIMTLIDSKSDLMKEIEKESSKYNIEVVNAITYDDTIIPGIKGRKVNIEKSFNSMKAYGHIIEDKLIYDGIIPSDTLSNNKDKYIIKGNDIKKEVSIIVIVNDNNLNRINNKDITLFINHNLITIENIKKLKRNEIYTYGNNGIYNNNILDNDNLLIDRLSNNKSNYCLSKEKNDDILNICSNKNMHTIIPNIIGGYNEIKNKLTNGSIILVNNIYDIDNIIKYIVNKGFTLVPLSILLEE